MCPTGDLVAACCSLSRCLVRIPVTDPSDRRDTRVFELLCNRHELSLLVSTQESGEADDWCVYEVADSSGIEQLLRKARDYVHVRGVMRSAVESTVVQSNAECVSTLIDPARRKSCIRQVEQVIQEFKGLFDACKLPWPQLTLTHLRTLSPCARRVHATLFRLTPSLARCLAQCLDLFAWLRSVGEDDTSFTNAVEMAMGVSEMECPAALWESGGESGIGRVSETKLSSLKNVRSYFHKLIFRPVDFFYDLDELSECLRAVLDTPPYAGVEGDMQLCAAHQMAFARLLGAGEQADSAAPNSVLTFQLQASKGIWVCANEGSILTCGSAWSAMERWSSGGPPSEVRSCVVSACVHALLSIRAHALVGWFRTVALFTLPCLLARPHRRHVLHFTGT